MRLMGLMPTYQNPNTSRPAPYLLKRLKVERPIPASGAPTSPLCPCAGPGSTARRSPPGGARPRRQATGGADPPGVVYGYADGRGGSFRRFPGAANCRAHTRRKLREVHERDGSKITKEGPERIAELCRTEAGLGGQSPEARRHRPALGNRHCPAVEPCETRRCGIGGTECLPRALLL